MREEKRQRREMQSRAADLETQAQTNRILVEANSQLRPKTRKNKKKKRVPPPKKEVTRSRPSSARRDPANSGPDSEHFRLNLADIPFTAGKVRSCEVKI